MTFIYFYVVENVEKDEQITAVRATKETLNKHPLVKIEKLKIRWKICKADNIVIRVAMAK